jgi:hypothetical protein
MPKITDLRRLFSPLNTPHDSIADFTPGIDTIDLSAIDANTHRNGNQKFHFEGIGPAHRGQGDTDGDGAYDVLIVLKGHHHLHAGRLHPLTLAGNGRRSPCARALDYTDWSAASDPRRRRRRSDQSRHRRASPCAEESLK